MSEDNFVYPPRNIGCSFKFLLRVGVEESIVKAPLASLQGKISQKVRLDLTSSSLICNS
jgi:hypothetical protein